MVDLRASIYWCRGSLNWIPGNRPPCTLWKRRCLPMASNTLSKVRFVTMWLSAMMAAILALWFRSLDWHQTAWASTAKSPRARRDGSPAQSLHRFQPLLGPSLPFSLIGGPHLEAIEAFHRMGHLARHQEDRRSFLRPDRPVRHGGSRPQLIPESEPGPQRKC